jgi:hypothetical protein
MDCKNIAPCIGNHEECLCFTDLDSPDPASNQFCGYVERDGKTVHPCAPNCCNGGMGCPGQCGGVDPKRPDAVRNVSAPVKYNTILSDKERLTMFENVFKFLIFLLILSVLSLFLRA